MIIQKLNKMEQTIYEVYSFESNEWVECGQYEFEKTEDKYRREVLVGEPFRQPNRLDLMSDAEVAITKAMFIIEGIGASENLTNAVIKLGQARDLVYEHYRAKNVTNI